MENYLQTIKNVHLPNDINCKKISFCEYAEWWLKNKEGLVAKSTFEGICIYLYKHILPYFQTLDLNIDDITPRTIYNYYVYAYKYGRSDKPGSLSIPSIKKHAMVLNGIFDDAVMDGIIQFNPVRSVKMPAKSEPTQSKHFATSDEINKILKAFNGHIIQKIIYVTIYYGLRRSEVLGLRWKAIDFDNNTISINHTVVRNLTIEEKDTTKTASSNRTYSLIQDVKEVLLERKREQDVDKLILGDKYIDNDYVFTKENGEILNPDYVTKAFKKILSKNNLPRMRFHDLRHSTASILFEKGWTIKEIQLWLRHSDISVTADIYTHVSESHISKKGNELNKTFMIERKSNQELIDSLSRIDGNR